MDSGKNAVPDIAPHILASRQRNRGNVSGEQADKGFGIELHNHTRGNAPRNGYKQSIAQRKPRAVMFAGSDILRAKRRDGLKHRRRHKEQNSDYFFHNADCRRVVQSPFIGKNSNYDKRNLDKSVLKSNRNLDF